VHRPSRLLSVLTYPQVPVILVGNKIDLRGGEVTNEALEHEIRPIMAEFKVPHARHVSLGLFLLVEWPIGSRDVRRMLRKDTSERLRGVLLRPEGCPPPNGSLVRLEKAGLQAFCPARSTEHGSNFAC